MSAFIVVEIDGVDEGPNQGFPVLQPFNVSGLEAEQGVLDLVFAQGRVVKFFLLEFVGQLLLLGCQFVVAFLQALVGHPAFDGVDEVRHLAVEVGSLAFQFTDFLWQEWFLFTFLHV